MFLTRVFGRTLFAAAKSDASAAASASAYRPRNPLEEFFEADRNPDDEKPVIYGRSWKASELRLKSWDDLNKLWYVLLKEKNMLMSQRQMLHAQNLHFPNPERVSKRLAQLVGDLAWDLRSGVQFLLAAGYFRCLLGPCVKGACLSPSLIAVSGP